MQHPPLQMQKDYFRYSRTQHILPSNLLMCKLMQVCCSAIENENTQSLRSTPFQHISLIITEDALGFLACTRHIQTSCWMKCGRMIFRR